MQADIYHAHVEKALPACYIAARLRHKPFIVDTPELTMSDPILTRWVRLRAIAIQLISYMVSHSAGYITGSPYYPQEISKLYHAHEVTVVRHAPPYRVITKNDRLRQYLSLDPNVHIALYQGGLQPNRGLDSLIHVVPFLDPNIIIVLMGNESRGTRTKLEAIINSNGYTDRVKIIDAVPYEELLDWTASADIGLTLFPIDYSLSIQKCLPNKFFEYLMAGLPIVSSQLDAISEMIHRYDVGKVVSSLDPGEIASAINGILVDQDGLARMSHNALEAAKSEFNWEKESEKLILLYNKILAKRNLSSEIQKALPE